MKKIGNEADTPVFGGIPTEPVSKSQASDIIMEDMIQDIYLTKTAWYGVLHLHHNMDFLIGLYCKPQSDNLRACIWRGWPKNLRDERVLHHIPLKGKESRPITWIDMSFKQIWYMFPEIKDLEWIRGVWPAPYNLSPEFITKDEVTI